MWRIFLRRLDLRQHRKIIVIDDEIAYTGSMNLVDPAFFKQKQWRGSMDRYHGACYGSNGKRIKRYPLLGLGSRDWRASVS